MGGSGSNTVANLPVSTLKHQSKRCWYCRDHRPNLPYCIRCGTENTYLHPNDFFHYAGESVEQAREQCQVRHPEMIEERKQSPYCNVEIPYCGICGINLYEQPPTTQ